MSHPARWPIRIFILRGVRVVAVLVVLAVIAGYAAAAVGWEWRWVHESRSGRSPGYRLPMTWLALEQGCIKAGHNARPSYVFGFAVDLPFSLPPLPQPRFEWVPLIHTDSISDGVGMRLPLWLLLIFAAPIAGHALVTGIRALRAVPGACARCGYDRAGLPMGAVCPECGAMSRP